ncbi:hypothetical protein J3R83DRAFT_10105 [Lanmaoa asiatica]|nr:hypothetical protein J3R83DRAFT_10105 [Lanmaoa asiatica]
MSPSLPVPLYRHLRDLVQALQRKVGNQKDNILETRRSRSKCGMVSVRAAIADLGNLAVMHGAKATTAIGCGSDRELDTSDPCTRIHVPKATADVPVSSSEVFTAAQATLNEFMGEDDSSSSTPHLSLQMQLPYCIPKRGRSDELDLERYSSESTVGNTVGNNAARVLITRIRATDVAIKLRRIPIGFYVAVKSENGTKRTSNKPVSVDKVVVEWEDEIVLPSDRSSRISLTVFASFELGPALGAGEDLGTFETTVGELLDHHRRLKCE